MLFATAAGLRDSPAGQQAIDRIAVAIVVTAVQIGPEASTVDNYANRQKWVAQALADDQSCFVMARRMFIAVVTSAPDVVDLDAGRVPPDTDLAATIASLVDTFAGRG